MRELIEQVREDRRAVGRSWKVWGHPGFHAVLAHRVGRWLRDQPLPWRLVTRPLAPLAPSVVRTLYQIDLPLSADVGRRLVVGHQSGVVVGPRVTIGDDCYLEHLVTITGDDSGAPRLGDRVYVGTGAVIQGGVSVGEGAVIEPHTIVGRDVAPRAHALPPRSEVHRPRRTPAAAAAASGRGQPAEGEPR